MQQPAGIQRQIGTPAGHGHGHGHGYGHGDGHGDGSGDDRASLTHDVRNMVTALSLYCDLLDQPGVLMPEFRHYSEELRLVAAASSRLVDKLARNEPNSQPSSQPSSQSGSQSPLAAGSGAVSAPFAWSSPAARQPRPTARRRVFAPAEPVENLAAELAANRNLLAALAGPSVTLGLETNGGMAPVAMLGEDLTRLLVNLVKNASEAMPSGGHIQIALEPCVWNTPAPDQPAGPRPGFAAAQPAVSLSGASSAQVPVLALRLTIADTGPGIPEQALTTIFEPGYSTRIPLAEGLAEGAREDDSWPHPPHRGLGLAIARSIVQSAHGIIHARNRPEGGAEFEITLPVSRE